MARVPPTRRGLRSRPRRAAGIHALITFVSLHLACAQQRQTPSERINVTVEGEPTLVLRPQELREVVWSADVDGRYFASLIGMDGSTTLLATGRAAANEPSSFLLAASAIGGGMGHVLIRVVAARDAAFGQARLAVRTEDQAPLPCDQPWISYPTSQLVVGAASAIAPTLTNSCGKIDAFTALTALPTGLALDATTGAVSGNATAVFPEQLVRVRASNARYQQEASFLLRVDDVTLTLQPADLRTTDIGSHDVEARRVTISTNAASVECDHGQGYGPCDAGPSFVWAADALTQTHRVRATSGTARVERSIVLSDYYAAATPWALPRLVVHACDEVVTQDETIYALMNRFATPAAQSQASPPQRPVLTSRSDQLAHKVVCLGANIAISNDPFLATPPLPDAPQDAFAAEPFHDLELRAPGLVLVGIASARATLRNTLSVSTATNNVSTRRFYNGLIRLVDGKPAFSGEDERTVIANLVMQASDASGPCLTVDSGALGGFVVSNVSMTTPAQVDLAWGTVVLRSHDTYGDPWWLFNTQIAGRIVTNSLTGSLTTTAQRDAVTPMQIHKTTIAGRGVVAFLHGPHRLAIEDSTFEGTGASALSAVIMDRGVAQFSRTTLKGFSAQNALEVLSPLSASYLNRPGWGGSSAAVATTQLTFSDGAITAKSTASAVVMSGGEQTQLTIERSLVDGESDVIVTSNNAVALGGTASRNQLTLNATQLRKVGGTAGAAVVTRHETAGGNPTNETQLDAVNASLACEAGGAFASSTATAVQGPSTTLTTLNALPVPIVSCAR